MDSPPFDQHNAERRRAIMDRLRSWTIESTPLPTIDRDVITVFPDPLEQFQQTLEAVGGQSYLVDSAAEIERILESMTAYADAKRIASVVPQWVAGNVDLSQIDDPHRLAALDWTIAAGEIVVAENGAIWVAGETLPHRVLLFIPQFLAIVASRAAIVSNMHEAYTKIGQPKPGFGVFVSGPSKTADIEQSLVLGAHGCRKLHVFLTP